ncbi:MAG: hypothetical protein JW741_00750 [Sedimentisphaerales bacterium]|nr:hypothetical protein [Sedimentisphaerales bacterium]
MATEAQVQANRLNARKSTGPRSDEGKAVASQNALKHGLLAQKAVIAGEDVGEFEFYRDELLGELSPDGAMESMLAERVVSLSWRLRRAERAQNEAFDTLLARVASDPFRRNARSAEADSDADGPQETPLGRAALRDFANGRVLERLSMYERRIEHSLYKSMNELQKMRLMRELEPETKKPPRPDNRWGKPEPASAMEQGAAGASCAGGGEASRQTKPIGREEKWGERGPATASQTRARAVQPGEDGFSGPVSAVPGPIVANEPNCAAGRVVGPARSAG